MTEHEFRTLALQLPETAEAEHMGHPDFRVAGRIFATLRHPRAGWAMVKLTPAQQAAAVRRHPRSFTPVAGGWGRRGCNNVRLRTAPKGLVREALRTAWTNCGAGRSGPVRG